MKKQQNRILSFGLIGVVALGSLIAAILTACAPTVAVPSLEPLATIVPSQKDTLPPTSTSTLKTSECSPWGKITLGDVGKNLCVSGQISSIGQDQVASYLKFDTAPASFYIISYGTIPTDLKTGACVQITGAVKQIGSAPVIILDKNLVTCTGDKSAVLPLASTATPTQPPATPTLTLAATPTTKQQTLPPQATLPPTAIPQPTAAPTQRPQPTAAPTQRPQPTAIPIQPTQPPAPTAARVCCKVCTASKACGDSCISKSKTCNVGPGCACDG